ncbi:MAG: amidohydrolase family protein, partial [Nitrososphaerales archaeon]
MRRSEAPGLKKLPSEYINEFYYTTQPLEQPRSVADQQKIFEMFDAENRLMYASDYPHWDWDVPSVIFDLPFLSKAAKKKILRDNAARFFNIV